MNESTTLQINESSQALTTATTGPSFEFFVIGMAINLVLIVAFSLWAFRQGKNK